MRYSPMQYFPSHHINYTIVEAKYPKYHPDMSLVYDNENNTINYWNLGGFHLEENEIIIYYRFFTPPF